MKKKKINNLKGFTLIELLAVIVILAVISLIAVPQVLKILNKARLSAAEDSTYGIVSATENYVGDLMLRNDGSYPKDDLEFECSDGCKLTNEIKAKLENYDLTNLEELKFKGSKPKGGKVIISDNGKITKVENLIINGFTCNYNEETNWKAKCTKGEDIEEPDEPTPPEPEIINIMVTFNTVGGIFNIDGVDTNTTTKEVTFNETYGELPEPTRENYTFIGWYTLPTYGETNKVTNATKVTTTEEQTLYAKWEGIKITVNFEANEGIGETPSKEVIYGEKYGDLPEVTKEGYTFNGWYTENNAGTIVTKDTTVTIASEQTLYASWIGINSTITFRPMEGTVNPISKEVVYGEQVGELPIPIRDGYTFDGWYTLPIYGEQYKVTSETEVTTTDNQTLYAKWIGNEYTITFDGNGGTVNPTSKNVTNGDTYGELPIPTREGYIFNGWYTAASGESQVTKDTTVSITADQTIYAQWKVPAVYDAPTDTLGLKRIVYFDPTTGEGCNTYVEANSTTGTKTGCMKWYAYVETDTTYTMILDHNTTAVVAWNSSGSNSSMGEVATKLNRDISEWVSGLNPRLITQSEITSITGVSSGHFEGSALSGQGTSKYYWLYDYTGYCTSYGCKVADWNQYNGVYIYGYWTSTPYSGTYAWMVNYYGIMNMSNVTSTSYGVRPVITVQKSAVS